MSKKSTKKKSTLKKNKVTRSTLSLNKEKKQSQNIHEEVIEKIIKLYNVDENKAKIYKAALYSKTKEENPGLSNLERSNKMLENTKKTYINKLDIDKFTNILQKHYQQKKKSKK